MIWLLFSWAALADPPFTSGSSSQPEPARLVEYRHQMLYTGSLVETNADRTTTEGLAVYQDGAVLKPRVYYETIGDTKSARRLRSRIQRDYWLAAIMGIGGSAMMFGSMPLLIEEDSATDGLVIASAGTVVALGALVPGLDASRANRYPDRVTLRGQIDRYNHDLRGRLGLSDSDTLAIDTR